MSTSLFAPVLRVFAIAATLGCGTAQAFVVDTTLLSATGTYSMDGVVPAVPLLDKITAAPFGRGVDVLEFVSNPQSGSSVGLHSYGSEEGYFGSRSSGMGVFDVTGSFTIVQTIRNDAATAQNAYFNFFITPGVVSTMSLAGAPQDNFLRAGTEFKVTLDSQAVWGSRLELNTSPSATTVSLGGDASIYQQVSLTQWNVAPDYVGRSAYLGSIGAGETVTLTYSLDTWASGKTEVSGVPQFPPVQVALMAMGDLPVDLPCDNPECGGGGAIPDGPTGELAGAGSNSGDPFGIDGDGNPISFYPGGFLPPKADGLQFSITNAPVHAVPEPETYAMMLAGLGMLGWVGRRRRAS